MAAIYSTFVRITNNEYNISNSCRINALFTNSFSISNNGTRITRSKHCVEIRAIKEETKQTQTTSFSSFSSRDEIRQKYNLEVCLWKIFSSKEDENGDIKKSKGDQAKELLAKYGGPI